VFDVTALPAFLPFLHSGAAVNWRAWTLDPSAIGGILVTIGMYFYVCDHYAGRVQAWRAASFVGGMTLILLALVSPIDAAAGRLLSMHMLQHVFLTTLGPPLILLGLPPVLLGALLRHRGLHLFRLMTNPLVAGPVFIVTMWIWHVPPVYQLALDHREIHMVMHATFIATGLLFWWPVIQPLPEPGSMKEGARLLYLFATGFPMELLALLLLASNTVVYAYYNPEPHLWGLAPVEDQQIGGLIMGGLGQIAAFVAITLLFFRYLDQEESREQALHPPIDAA
jgi:putative membrane protein